MHASCSWQDLRSLIRLIAIAACGAALSVTLCACTAAVNPSFAITTQEAYRDLDRMRESRQPLVRPLVVLGGYKDPGFAPGEIVRVMRTTLEGEPIIQVTFATARDFDECRERVLDAVLAAVPGRFEVAPGHFETAEVDVIANSMGGLVARYAGLWPESAESPESTTTRHTDTRLRIVRLMTISTPHQGAALASSRSWNALERDMAAGSPFLAKLDMALAEADFELICYARLGDAIVGVENTAPPGEIPYWVSPPALQASHLLGSHDRRVLADIARRLRGETPLTSTIPAPLPP